jgi:hypothetical protein
LNSAAKSLIILFAGFGLLLVAGCSDHGPTNLYSKPLFNQGQDGARMEIDRWNYNVWESGGSSFYSIALKNTGNGSALGPITGVLSAPLGSCATITLSTAKFGDSGQIIKPDDIVYSQPVSFKADFSSCANASVTLTVTLSDKQGSTWTESFLSDGYSH